MNTIFQNRRPTITNPTSSLIRNVTTACLNVHAEKLAIVGGTPMAAPTLLGVHEVLATYPLARKENSMVVAGLVNAFKSRQFNWTFTAGFIHGIPDAGRSIVNTFHDLKDIVIEPVALTATEGVFPEVSKAAMQTLELATLKQDRRTLLGRVWAANPTSKPRDPSMVIDDMLEFMTHGNFFDPEVMVKSSLYESFLGNYLLEKNQQQTA